MSLKDKWDDFIWSLNEAQWQKLRADAKTTLAGFDRASLGTLVSDEGVVIDSYALLLLTQRKGKFPFVFMASSTLRYIAARAYRGIDSFEDRRVINAVAEVHYFTGELVTDWGLQRYDFDCKLRSELLTRAMNATPDVREFYFSGIWDDEFIARCIADGVDTQMALALGDSR